MPLVRSTRARRNQRSGLVGEHLEVVLDGVFAGAGPDRLVQLPEAEPFESIGLQADRPFTENREQLARAGEQQVSGEDRYGVAPYRVGSGHASTLLRFIHHVVVVQRGEVDEFDRGCRGDHVVGDTVAELGGQKGQERANTLATGVEKVSGRHLGHAVVEGRLGDEVLLEAFNALLDRAVGLAVVSGGEESFSQRERGRRGLAAPGPLGGVGSPENVRGAVRRLHVSSLLSRLRARGLHAAVQGDDAEGQIAVANLLETRF
jgi:hypothetical protein